MGKIRQQQLYWCQECNRCITPHKGDLINHLRKRHGIVTTKKIIKESKTPRIVKRG